MKQRLLVLALFTLTIGISGQKISIDSDITMLALGDSYTIGESVIESQRWPHQFVAALRKLDLAVKDPDYIATTGWTTTQLIQGIDIYLNREKKYNLVSILIGVNNQYQGLDIFRYKPELITIIKLALDIVDQDPSRVFLLSIPDYAFTPFGAGKSSISKEIDEYNAIKKQVAKEYKIAYIDITPISRTGLNAPSLVASDGLHPSGEQYGKWVEEILSHSE
jgi:acyl-CoA thioesterase-1